MGYGVAQCHSDGVGLEKNRRVVQLCLETYLHIPLPEILNKRHLRASPEGVTLLLGCCIEVEKQHGKEYDEWFCPLTRHENSLLFRMQKYAFFLNWRNNNEKRGLIISPLFCVTPAGFKPATF